MSESRIALWYFVAGTNSPLVLVNSCSHPIKAEDTTPKHSATHRKNNVLGFPMSHINSGVAAFAFRKYPELQLVLGFFLVSVETCTSIL